VRRERIKVRPRAPRVRPWLEVLPLDPRDELVVRAKQARRSKEKRR
jgi:hypothetical protein